MQKKDIIEKLKGLGIETENVFPKASFPKNGEICVGLFEREMKDDFYFYNSYDKKIYRIKQQKDLTQFFTEDFRGDTKFMIPNHEWEIIWEDVPYVELPDKPFREMTLREYACIKLGIPMSNNIWLDELIKRSKELKL